jgi:acyl carrier protein
VNVIEQVRGFISDTFFVDDIPEDESFLRTGVIDSMGMLELVDFVESTFGVKIDDDELIPENLDSLRNLDAFLHRKRSAGAAV